MDTTYHPTTQKVPISKRKNSPPKTSTVTEAMDIPPSISFFFPIFSSTLGTPSKLLLSAKEVPLQRISDIGDEKGSEFGSVSRLSNSKSFLYPDAYLLPLEEGLAASFSDAILSASVDLGGNIFLLNFLNRRSDANFTSVSGFLTDSVKGIIMTITIKSKAEVN